MKNEIKDFLEQDEFYQEGILTDVRAMVLTRKNLCREYLKTPFERVEWQCFKYRNNAETKTPTKLFLETELVIFVDDSGRTKIMKNRWGNTGDVIKK